MRRVVEGSVQSHATGAKAWRVPRGITIDQVCAFQDLLSWLLLSLTMGCSFGQKFMAPPAAETPCNLQSHPS